MKKEIKGDVDIEPSLRAKIGRYIGSMGLGGERRGIQAECRRLEVELGIGDIKPREYVFLSKVQKAMELGRKPDLKTMALQAGYGIGEAQEPEVQIMRKMDSKLVSLFLGFSRNDIEKELVKVMKQDDDLSAKIRALEVGSKILGMQEDKAVSVQINTGIKLGE